MAIQGYTAYLTGVCASQEMESRSLLLTEGEGRLKQRWEERTVWGVSL